MDKKKFKKGQIVIFTHRQHVLPAKLLTSIGSGRLPDTITIGTYGPLHSIMWKDICLCEIHSHNEPLFHMSKLNNKSCVMLHESRIIRHATDEEKKEFYKSKTKSK